MQKWALLKAFFVKSNNRMFACIVCFRGGKVAWQK